MNAHPRPLPGLIAAIFLSIFGDLVATAVAQAPPETSQPTEQFAASRDEVCPPAVPGAAGVPLIAGAPAVPFAALGPPPAAAPPVPAAPRLGGWTVAVPVPVIAPDPRLAPRLRSFDGTQIPAADISPSVGYFAMTNAEPAAAVAHQRPQSLEPNYGNFLDRQTPLARAENAAYVARPLTSFAPAISPYGLADIATYGPTYIGGTGRGDAVAGTAQLSQPTAFVPGSIPVQTQPTFGLPQPAQVVTTAIGSRLFLESYVTTPIIAPVRVFSQLDGFVQTNGNSGGSMPHLFGQLKSLIVGKADTFFSDPRAFPNQIDIAGPNALVYLEHVLIGYVFEHQFSFAALETGLSLENPEPTVTPPDPKNVDKFKSVSQIPDIAGRARLWDPVWGHVQFASIVRSVGIENLEYTTGTGKTKVVHPASNQQVIGWGVQCTGMLHPFDGIPCIAYDLIGFGGSYGRGITSYFPDFGPNSGLPTGKFSGLDAMFDDQDQLRALPLSSFCASYTHLWTEQLRSTVVYSQVDLKSFDSPDFVPPPGQPASPYRRGRYFAVNLLYEFDVTAPVATPTKGRGFTGVEYLYGRKELLDGKYGDAHRVQVVAGAKY